MAVVGLITKFIYKITISKLNLDHLHEIRSFANIIRKILNQVISNRGWLGQTWYVDKKQITEEEIALALTRFESRIRSRRYRKISADLRFQLRQIYANSVSPSIIWNVDDPYLGKGRELFEIDQGRSEAQFTLALAAKPKLEKLEKFVSKLERRIA